MKIPVKLSKEEYKYLLEILENEKAEIKADIQQGIIDPESGPEKLQMLLRINHAVSFLDREK